LEYGLVNEGWEEASALPLVSTHFYYCRALCLTDGRTAGLAHMIPDMDTEEALDILLSKIPENHGDLKAILIESDAEYGHDLIGMLEDREIPLSAIYQGTQKNSKGMPFPRHICVSTEKVYVLVYREDRDGFDDLIFDF